MHQKRERERDSASLILSYLFSWQHKVKIVSSCAVAISLAGKGLAEHVRSCMDVARKNILQILLEKLHLCNYKCISEHIFEA